MTKKNRIPKEIYNFALNAEYHLESALILDDKKHTADRMYLLLVALENISLADKIHSHWINNTKIPDIYFKRHGLKLDGVRNPVIRIQFDKTKKTTKEIHYKSAEQLEKILNDLRYGPGKGSQSIQNYFKDSRWFDDEFIKEIQTMLRWTKLSIELSEKFIKEELQ